MRIFWSSPSSATRILCRSYNTPGYKQKDLNTRRDGLFSRNIDDVLYGQESDFRYIRRLCLIKLLGV